MSWFLNCSRGVGLALLDSSGFWESPKGIDNFLLLTILGVRVFVIDLFLCEVTGFDISVSNAPSLEIKLLFFFKASSLRSMDDISDILIPWHSIDYSFSFLCLFMHSFIFYKFICLSPSTKSISPRYSLYYFLALSTLFLSCEISFAIPFLSFVWFMRIYWLGHIAFLYLSLLFIIQPCIVFDLQHGQTTFRCLGLASGNLLVHLWQLSHQYGKILYAPFWVK